MTYITRTLVLESLILAIAVFFGTGIGHTVESLPLTASSSVALVTPAVKAPVSIAHLIIPAIGVNARIQEMGLTVAGAMAVPGNQVDVGWYRLGTRPGQIGSAVIGGHNVWNDGAGAFVHLDHLKQGDVVSVVDAKGVSTSFVVREMRTYDATDTHSGIFESESGTHLNLITCSGVWDPVTKTYSTRLVIFTDAV